MGEKWGRTEEQGGGYTDRGVYILEIHVDLLCKHHVHVHCQSLHTRSKSKSKGCSISLLLCCGMDMLIFVNCSSSKANYYSYALHWLCVDVQRSVF